MSSSELSDDELSYLEYKSWRVNDESGTPFFKKRSRLLLAAVQNDIETFKELLDSPKWYKVRDRNGKNLLHIAMESSSKEVFDYLLSLEDFSFETVDEEINRIFALMSPWNRHRPSFFKNQDYNILALLKKGADMGKDLFADVPLLHYSVKYGLVKVMHFLLERGADANAQCERGQTPLDECMINSFSKEVAITEECITMLLCYGADPSMWMFLDEYLIDWNKTLVARENVFYFVVDEWKLFEISGSSLLRMARQKSQLFHPSMFKYFDVYMDTMLESNCFALFSMPLESLQILLDNFPSLVEEALYQYPSLVKGVPGSYSLNQQLEVQYGYVNSLHLKNFDLLLQSCFYSDTIELISNINSNMLIDLLAQSRKPKDEIIEIIYYLLSYGMPLYEYALGKIYEIIGYSEDFKNFLFIDVQKRFDGRITEIMPRLVYDVTLDVHSAVENPTCDFVINWKQIFEYFCHPRIQNAYCVKEEDNELIKKQLPPVPLLLELARDSFRKYFIEYFKITTAKQFYSLIKLLLISSPHKKIITFETKLYHIE